MTRAAAERPVTTGRAAHLQLQLEQRHRRQAVGAQQLRDKEVSQLVPPLLCQQPLVPRAISVSPEDEQRDRGLEVGQVVARRGDEVLPRVRERGGDVVVLYDRHELLHAQPEDEAALGAPEA
jgi:hypothetical protein